MKTSEYPCSAFDTYIDLMPSINFSDTVDRKNLSSYYDRTRDLKAAVKYVEEPERFSSKSKSKASDESILKEIKQLNNAKHDSALRKELFDGDDSSGLRKRGVNDNMEQYYANIQEKISDDMLALTRNLKEQTLTASKIIKKDTEVVLKSSKIAHQNTGSLEKESKKLDEHSRKACKCWVWIMMGLVIAIFIGMVLFMKLMKKSK